MTDRKPALSTGTDICRKCLIAKRSGSMCPHCEPSALDDVLARLDEIEERAQPFPPVGNDYESFLVSEWKSQTRKLCAALREAQARVEQWKVTYAELEEQRAVFPAQDYDYSLGREKDLLDARAEIERLKVMAGEQKPSKAALATLWESINDETICPGCLVPLDEPDPTCPCCENRRLTAKLAATEQVVAAAKTWRYAWLHHTGRDQSRREASEVKLNNVLADLAALETETDATNACPEPRG